MASFRKLSLLLALFLTVIIILIIPVTSQPQPQPQACESYKFPNNTNFLACNDLPVLDSSLHWTYHPSSNSIDVAFKKNNANYKRWIAWAINPTSTGMVGSQAFVAFQKSDGTMAAYTSPIGSYGTTLEEGSLSFEVHGVSASFEDGTVILYASFQLPGNPKSVNHVWQEGSWNIEWNRVGNYDANRSDNGTLSKNIGSYWVNMVPFTRACRCLLISLALLASLSASSCQARLSRLCLHMVLFMPPLESPCLSLATVQVLAAIFLRLDKHHKAESSGTSSTTSWAMESFASPSSTCLEASPFQTLPTVGRMLILASSFHWVVWL
ncbi:hypothetical protein K1719_044737 [Acacia pycnantha]|nr:hypothetical protein K1719_044737 [Acacia pycnantha]